MAVNRLFELEGLKVVYGELDSPPGKTTSVTTPSGTTNLWYDCEDRLTSLTGNGLNDGFSSNAFDTRVQKTDATGVHNYMRDGSDPTDSLLSDRTSTFNPGISQRTSGSTTVNHYNYLGSVTAQTAGLAESNPNYDAFGNLTTGPPAGPFGFAGGYGYQTDSDTGLQLLGHRYYDSSIGRFITRDPAQDGSNWYSYCENNPASEADEDGLIHIVITIGEGGIGIGNEYADPGDIYYDGDGHRQVAKGGEFIRGFPVSNNPYPRHDNYPDGTYTITGIENNPPYNMGRHPVTRGPDACNGPDSPGFRGTWVHSYPRNSKKTWRSKTNGCIRAPRKTLNHVCDDIKRNRHNKHKKPRITVKHVNGPVKRS